MEEEISYSTLVFKNKALTEQKKKPNMATCSGESPEERGSTGPKLNEEATIYSSIKHKDAVTAGQQEKHDLGTKPERKTEEPVATEPKGRSALESGIILSLLCLGILFLVGVVVVVVLLVNLNILMNKQQENITHLTNKNIHLILENGNLTNQTEQLLVKNRVLENQTEQLLVNNQVLGNQTEQLLVKNRVLENQTEQLLVKNKVLGNQTEQLLMENRVLKNQSEELLVENKNLTNQTEQLLVKNRVLENQTEQLLVKNKVLENQTEQLLVENRVLKNQSEELLVENKNLTNQANQLLMEKRVLENRTEQLMEKTRILENQTAVLSKEKDNLNWTLEVILTFENFPVKVFCPQKKCQPCLDGWTILNQTCYMFDSKPDPWRTWNQSRQFCKAQNADLVVIDSLEEQKFVSNHSSFYFDKYHGYWLGLRNVSNSWTWVDGRIDTLKYWIDGTFGSSGPFALLIPQRNLTKNWDTSDHEFQNRFICERQALIRSD